MKTPPSCDSYRATDAQFDARADHEGARFLQRAAFAAVPLEAQGAVVIRWPDLAQICRCARRARALGFDLRAAAELLTFDAAVGVRRPTPAAIDGYITEIEDKLIDLMRLRQALLGMRQRAAGDADHVPHPVLEALLGEPDA